MIGDTPETDIDGANQMGWVSILVKTGMFKGEELKVFKPKYVVEDLKEAINLIYQIEELSKTVI